MEHAFAHKTGPTSSVAAMRGAVSRSTPRHPFDVAQRKCGCAGPGGLFGECQECKAERDAPLQRRGTRGNDPATAPPIVHDVLRSPGQPLDHETRAFMGPRFGHDFSQVRVHTDARAADSARAVDALAYTVGRDVVFAQGRYQPAATEGRRLLAHELAHVVQQRTGATGLMRQAVTVDPQEHLQGTEVPEGLPHQCPDDADLDAEYEEWIHYDPEKDADETALVNRINQEIFGPINLERNKIAAESFETTAAKTKAFPTGTLEPGAAPARRSLFNRPSYAWLHSAAPEDTERQSDIGVSQPVGDLAATGKISANTYGASTPVGTIWDYRGARAQAAGYGIDATETAPGIEGQQSVSGYAEFKDPKGQRIFVPQLGFGQKPRVDTRQVMCHETPVVKPGRARRLGGPTGQDVTGLGLGDIAHGGKHFFGKGTGPTITGTGEVIGWRVGPDKPVQWMFGQLPDDPDKRDKIDETMRKKADSIVDAKRKNYETLEQFYLKRAAFIAKYRDSLK